MLHNYLIIIPLQFPLNWTVDYYLQTALILSHHNTVVFYDVFHHQSPKNLAKNNSQIFNPVFFVPFQRFLWIKKINHFINISWILWKSKKNRPVLFWCFHPFDWKIVEPWKKKATILYDCVDFHRGLEFEEDLGSQEDKLIENCDVFSVNSMTLKKLHHSKRSDVILSPLGFRLQNFSTNVKGRKHISKSGRTLTVGYIGGVNSRIDMFLLYQLAVKLPYVKFILWGPHQGLTSKKWDKYYQSFTALPNVVIGESQDKQEIPHIVSSFDIAIIPYKATQNFNKYCYPMKLFEYFYMGKPVISTPIEELKRFPKFVKLGNTVEEWESHIKTLLAKPWPTSYKQEQRQLAKANSWENKIKAISEVIESYERKKR